MCCCVAGVAVLEGPTQCVVVLQGLLCWRALHNVLLCCRGSCVGGPYTVVLLCCRGCCVGGPYTMCCCVAVVAVLEGPTCCVVGVAVLEGPTQCVVVLQGLLCWKALHVMLLCCRGSCVGGPYTVCCCVAGVAVLEGPTCYVVVL